MTELWRALALAAGLVAAASLPAAAVNLPDAGTKNFTPPSQTPSYLMDEKSRTPAGRDEAPTTESRPSEEAAPATAATPEPSTAAVSHPQAGKHGRASRLARARGGHGGRYAHAGRGRSGTRTAGGRSHRPRTHTASAVLRGPTHAAARTRTGSSGKTRTAKPQTAKRQAAAFGRRRLLDSA